MNKKIIIGIIVAAVAITGVIAFAVLNKGDVPEPATKIDTNTGKIITDGAIDVPDIDITGENADIDATKDPTVLLTQDFSPATKDKVVLDKTVVVDKPTATTPQYPDPIVPTDPTEQVQFVSGPDDVTVIKGGN